MIICTVDKIIDETHDTKTFRLMPEKQLNFKPGQFVMLHILENGKSVASKAYSISSSPFDSHIDLTVKLHMNFTRRLWQLTDGEKVGITGPFGIFVLNDQIKSATMIAGGVGVTPLMCMIRYAINKLFDCKITLLYSNKTVKDIIFYNELLVLERKYKNFQLMCTTTREQANGLHHGRIDADMIFRCSDGDATFFLCGSDDFVKNMRSIILEKGVVNNRILAERFGEFA